MHGTNLIVKINWFLDFNFLTTARTGSHEEQLRQRHNGRRSRLHRGDMEYLCFCQNTWEAAILFNILSVFRTCHLELSSFLCKACHINLLFQVKTENPVRVCVCVCVWGVCVCVCGCVCVWWGVCGVCVF